MCIMYAGMLMQNACVVQGMLAVFYALVFDDILKKSLVDV